MHNKLKVGILLDDSLDVPDGVQQYVLTIGNWLYQNGHSVYYIVGQTNRKDISNVYALAKNFRVSFNGNTMRIPYYSSKSNIKNTLNNLNLDVLHVQMPYSPFYAGKVINCVSSNVNVVATFHIAPASNIVTHASKALSLISRGSMGRINSFISVSKAAQQFANDTYGIDSTVLPCVITANTLVHKPIYKKTPHIVFLGRLVKRKGVILLLEALVKLNKLYNLPYKVSIGGKGAHLNKLQEYAKQNNLSNIKFLGFVSEEEKVPLLASADIAVFPSTGGESFGIVLLEAMASGARVVLGGNNPGYSGVLGGYPKQLIDPKNTIEFANRLKYFLENSKFRQDSYLWNQNEYKKYDINIVGKDILNIYYKHKQ